MANTTSVKNHPRMSLAMQRTGQWVSSQDIPIDVIVEVGEANFSLHKFMLIAKSNYIRKLILETKEADFITRINLSDVPGGPEIFEKAAKFCYGVNFEITVHNVAALRCAAEFLEMTENYCDNNLAVRTEDFLTQVGLSSFSGALVVLKSCEDLVPLAEDLKIVERCLNIVAAKACVEANFPSRSPPNWWTEELSILDIYFFEKIIASMKSRGAKGLAVASAITAYAEKSLRDLMRDHSGNSAKSIEFGDSDKRIEQCELLESIVALLPPEKTVFPINFLCCLLRSAIFLRAATSCKNELEKRISFILEHVTVDDLLVICLTYDGQKLFDLESVRRIISGFVEKEKSVGVFNGGEYREVCSSGLLRVAKTVDAFLSEIAGYNELSISKFNGIAYLVPKGARKVEDDLYRAIDIYLKAHSDLDEIEREKVCSVMDPLKLSYEARLHASQNKRLPVQVVLHALYYDQLKIRSGTNDDHHKSDAMETRSQLQADVSLMKENEALRNELLKMKMYVEDLHRKPGSSVKGGSGSSVKGSGSSIKGSSSGKKATFFSSVSKTLGKLNPFKINGSKDTSNIDDWGVDLTKPRKRRFSIS